jgi:hypothetical protein
MLDRQVIDVQVCECADVQMKEYEGVIYHKGHKEKTAKSTKIFKLKKVIVKK